jgi:hypothetical protein
LIQVPLMQTPNPIGRIAVAAPNWHDKLRISE